MVYVIYVSICLLIGVVGMRRKFGFWGYFFGSILTTPVIGLLLVISSDPRKSSDR